MKRLILGVGILATAFFLSCESPVTNERERNELSFEQARHTLNGALRPVQKKSVTDLAKTPSGGVLRDACNGVHVAVMYPERGGKIEHCGYAMIVPPGAIGETEKMYIEVVNGETISADFGRDGEFKVPVTIRLPLNEADLKTTRASDLTVAWWDKSSNSLIDIGGTVYPELGYIEAQTTHFTVYTLSTK